MPENVPAKRLRGRPVGFDRREAIEAAMQLFWREGFEKVSVADLAEAMGIRRSSFYNSFGARDAVFREAIGLYAGLAPDAALASIGPENAVGPALRRVFRDICRVRSADPESRGCMVVNAIGELVGSHPELGEEIAAMTRRQTRRMEALLKQAVASGECDAIDDPRAAARAFVAFLAGLNTLSKVETRRDALWKACDDFLTRYGF